MDENNKELYFLEELKYMSERFESGSQEGVKEALRFCQDTFGYVSLAHQKQIAEFLNVDDKIVKTLIKFTKSIKESKTEFEVICCTGPRCAKNGSIEVIKSVKNTLGIDFDETSKDGKIRLSTQNCFKQCSKGPNIMINGKFYHNMDKNKAENLMKEIME